VIDNLTLNPISHSNRPISINVPLTEQPSWPSVSRLASNDLINLPTVPARSRKRGSRFSHSSASIGEGRTYTHPLVESLSTSKDQATQSVHTHSIAEFPKPVQADGRFSEPNADPGTFVDSDQVADRQRKTIFDEAQMDHPSNTHPLELESLPNGHSSASILTHTNGQTTLSDQRSEKSDKSGKHRPISSIIPTLSPTR
jgi:hypothetical protein